MLVIHLLDTIDPVPTTSLMKNKISPERKIKLHKPGAEDPRETTGLSEESDSEYELEFTPNQHLHLLQTLPIYPRKVAQNPTNFVKHQKSGTIEPKMNPLPQDIANEGGSDHKTNQQDQYVDFNESELNEETSPDLFNCNTRISNFIEVSHLVDQSLPRTNQQKLKKIIQLEESKEFLSNNQIPAQATKSKATVIRAPDQRLRNIIEIQDPKIYEIVSQQSVTHLTQHTKSQKETPPDQNTMRKTPPD